MNNKQICILFMLFLLSFASTSFNVSTIVSITSTMKRLLNSGCVTLLYSEDTPLEWILQLCRCLANANVATALLPINSHLSPKCRNYPILYVIPSFSEYVTRNPTFQEKIRMQRPTWLFFLKNQSEIEYFHDLYIPLYCDVITVKSTDGEITISKLYHIDNSSPLQESILFAGKIDLLHSISFSEVNHKSVPNFLGKKLKISVIHNPPITILDNAREELKIKGFFADVLKTLGALMNFNIYYIIPPEKTFGAYLGNDSWTGMVGAVLRNETDLGLGLSRNQERSIVIDFSIPIFYTSYRAYIRDPGNNTVFWGTYISPFSHRLWLGIGGCFLISALILFLNDFLLLGCELPLNKCFFVFIHSIFETFGVIFCQQGHSRIGNNISSRLIILSVLLTSVVLYNAYSGALISHLTVKRTGKIFDSLNDLINDNSYVTGTLNGSAKKTYLIEFISKNGSKHDFPEDYPSGFEKICNQKFAFLVPQFVSDLYVQQANCKITPLPKIVTPASMACVFNKNSSLYIINNWILKFHNTGIMDRLKKHTMPRKTDEETKIAFSGIYIDQILPAVAILIFGIILSVMFLSLEILHKRQQIKYTNIHRFQLNHKSKTNLYSFVK